MERSLCGGIVSAPEIIAVEGAYRQAVPRGPRCRRPNPRRQKREPADVADRSDIPEAVPQPMVIFMITGASKLFSWQATVCWTAAVKPVSALATLEPDAASVLLLDGGALDECAYKREFRHVARMGASRFVRVRPIVSFDLKRRPTTKFPFAKLMPSLLNCLPPMPGRQTQSARLEQCRQGA